LDVFPIQPDLKVDDSYALSTWKRAYPESGVVKGRVVQASLEYPFRKTYEVIIQESENANNFRAMSIHDGRLFRYISRAMLTGKPMVIEYVRLYQAHGRFVSTLFNYMTHYRIVAAKLDEEASR